ncbi:hypothetical protein [Streptomyces sp. H27-C3]|uniref:hypothetical protein n=1 Tax=Streptomyces sp. H27-C3 TaxID=3046305 RepID=UPI0024BB9BDA|nr:hypothetical protein [Streptomyces sp. H27-C3]MDJ0466012.1 hypothetical protein [Streptomyces sp. H27-C3]
MSVIGQEAGIDHGSMRGYRQHTYRKVAATEECGCLAAVREAQRTSKPVPERSQKQREWYGGQYVTAASGSQPGRRILAPGDCPVDGCGQEVAGRSVQRRGWVRIHVQGSTMPARAFCSGSCATVGIALAELRMDTPASS